jgi:hypothetical protein
LAARLETTSLWDNVQVSAAPAHSFLLVSSLLSRFLHRRAPRQTFGQRHLVVLGPDWACRALPGGPKQQERLLRTFIMGRKKRHNVEKANFFLKNAAPANEDPSNNFRGRLFPVSLSAAIACTHVLQQLQGHGMLILSVF